MERESFIFYRSFYEAIKELPRDIQGEVLTAIMEYGLNGATTGNLKPIARAIVTLIKPQLEANNKRFENGKKGGRPSTKRNQKETKTKPNENQKETKGEPNVNVINNNNNNNGVFKNAVLSNPQYLEVTAMQHKTNIETVKNYLGKFEKHLIQIGEIKQNEKEFKQHFTFWLNKQQIKTTHNPKKIRYV